MKHGLLAIFLGGVALALLVASPAAALSCLPQSEMLNQYVEDTRYTIVTAAAGDTVEHVVERRSELSPDDFDGYIGQYLTITESHLGSSPDARFVYFHVMMDWGTGCVSAPPEAGTTNVYVIDQSDAVLGLPTVRAVFPVDSALADDLRTQAELAAAARGGNTYEQTPQRWTELLGAELREMITIMRIKLAEWRYWRGQVGE